MREKIIFIPHPSRVTVMARIARANRVAIQKILPTRNLWSGQPQDAGAEPRQVRNQNNKTKNTKKGAGGHEHVKKNSGKSAAGAVPFYETPRLHHLHRDRPFQRNEQGNGGRQNRAAYQKRSRLREGGERMKGSEKIHENASRALKKRPACGMMALLRTGRLSERSSL
jgi:hypothetical protein